MNRKFVFALLLWGLAGGKAAIGQVPVNSKEEHTTVSVEHPTTRHPIPMSALVKGNYSLDIDRHLAPPATKGVQGVVGGAGITLRARRDGGFGVYGYDLTDAFVTANVPALQFDVAKTAWLTATRWTGGQGFGGWFGANTPSSAKPGEVYTAGAAIGAEINVGNCWADFGPQYDIGTKARYTVGLQVVPDPLPADDVVTKTTYPGTFGIVVAHAQFGHRWWTGFLNGHDSIMANGHARITRGGSSASDAPGDIEYVDGYWRNGIDLTNAKISDAAVVMADGQKVCFSGKGACVYHEKGKLYYDVAGVHVFSVSDESGDAVFKGAVTQHGTP